MVNLKSNRRGKRQFQSLLPISHRLRDPVPLPPLTHSHPFSRSSCNQQASVETAFSISLRKCKGVFVISERVKMEKGSITTLKHWKYAWQFSGLAKQQGFGPIFSGSYYVLLLSLKILGKLLLWCYIIIIYIIVYFK